jgi:preprotein translocase subunit SecB
MATIQNAINFISFNITNVVFERPHDFKTGEFQIHIEHLSQIHKEDKNSFQTIFIVTISDNDKKFNLQVKAIADFQIVGEIEKEVYNSFVNINDPAIAYPYLRAFVSNIIVQAGMPPIIIPPINFTKKAPAKPEVKE